MKKQVDDFHKLHGYYPEVVIGDQIYGTQTNRSWLKELGIRFSGKPSGRPSEQWQDPKIKKQRRIEQGKRNEIEGKFGQGKNGYNLNKIRARRSRTSESWIACIFFVMNLIHLEANHFFGSFFRWIKSLAEASVFDTAHLDQLLYIRISNQSRNFRLFNCLT